MENFAILCPELAFKIEYYADAAAYQDSVGTECGRCAAVLEVVRTGMCWLSTANGCWRHGSIQLCMGYFRQRVLLMRLL